MGLFDGNMPYSNLHNLNLDWVLRKVKEYIKIVDDANRRNAKEFVEINRLIRELFDWVNAFDPELVRKIVNEYLVTGVYFGLTDAGYFVAYVPQAWKDVVFATTGKDIELELEKEYGHLVLIY